MANIFDPQSFFSSTAFYASQGRGLFVLKSFPRILEELKDDTITIGLEQLNKGLLAARITTAGAQVATYEGFSFSGPTRRQAHTSIYSDIQVDFLMMGATLQESQALFYTMNTWQKLITKPAADYSGSDSTPFTVGYYDDYIASKAVIALFSPTLVDNNPGVVVEQHYHEIYPINIGPLNMAWDSVDAPMTLSVTFTTHYVETVIPKNTI